jgi:hypothetical protein
MIGLVSATRSGELGGHTYATFALNTHVTIERSEVYCRGS